MMNNLKNTYFIETVKGIFSVTINSKNKITELRFPSKKLNNTKFLVNQPVIIKELLLDLNKYFLGENINLTKYKFEIEGTNFQKQVWGKIKNIPYGSTISYGELAESICSKAYRAVGSACGKNPVPILIPCHRVIAKNNRIGGFSSGLKWKKFLLSLEQNKKNFL